MNPSGGSLSRALHVANVGKSFRSPAGRRIEVLKDVSFSLAAGEVVAVMGASGAGKSTLFHIVGGLEPSDTGTVNVVSDSQPALSFVFQFHYLLADLTALENVSLPLRIQRLARNQVEERAKTILEEVGLADRAHHKIGFLSGGERQRVAVARALVTQPGLVLADEPTGNLDKSIASEIGSILATYARHTRAMVLLATHNDALATASDRILVLANGRLHDGRSC